PASPLNRVDSQRHFTKTRQIKSSWRPHENTAVSWQRSMTRFAAIPMSNSCDDAPNLSTIGQNMNNLPLTRALLDKGFPPLSDEELVWCAEEVFLELDGREAHDAES